MPGKKIVITGAAGLLGQNLIQRLSSRGYNDLVAIDKHQVNAKILQELHPGLKVVVADLASGGAWESELSSCDTLILAHAQIGGLDHAEFVRNNVEATRVVLAAATRSRVPYLVHISSSVVYSLAVDSYTETKKQQEAIVVDAGFDHVVLRPTLMFGWFDRKHLGWLARFMLRTPVFPIPGSGDYLRQPLYVRDFCDIIIASVEKRTAGKYNISGQNRITYIELIRTIHRAINSKARIQKIPYSFFWLLLKVYALIDRNPPFTVTQLEALVTPDVFEVIDWPTIFGVSSTPLDRALVDTFQDPVYSKVVLDF